MLKMTDKAEIAATVRSVVARHGLLRHDADTFRTNPHRIADEHAAQVRSLESEALAAVARRHLRIGA